MIKPLPDAERELCLSILYILTGKQTSRHAILKKHHNIIGTDA